MNNTELLGNISFSLSSVAFCRVGREWNYENIISSFSRLFLVTEGEASLHLGGKNVLMKKGHLYLVPGLSPCTYTCPEHLEHYYALFTIYLPGNLNIYQLFNFETEVKAASCHYEYFHSLCRENPFMALPTGDPHVYQRRILNGVDRRQRDARESLLTAGILNLLLSEFIGSTQIDLETDAECKIAASIRSIHMNLGEMRLLERLAEESCMSKDHYTRRFKELTRQTPVDYINRHRVEKAQLLLSSTSLSMNEIAEQCGFKSNAYFSRVFKKYVEQTPSDYRKTPEFIPPP